MPRLYCPLPLLPGQTLALPAGAARHVQVLRMQPGQALVLFNGQGGQFAAQIVRMGRSDVEVVVGEHSPLECEAPRAVHLLCGLMANERMDWLVEKATELGAASLWPLQLSRSVLRLQGERAQRRQAHWQAVAQAAAEQCGRNRLPPVHEISALAPALAQAAGFRAVLSLEDDAVPLGQQALPADAPAWLLSGPEGGLTEAEEAQARAQGFVPVRLGPRVLRAETAPLAALAWLAGDLAGPPRA
jgi:16S rRNA (uracil1498-N3)-methyltransferase